jgi:hypothetical protein
MMQKSMDSTRVAVKMKTTRNRTTLITKITRKKILTYNPKIPSRIQSTFWMSILTITIFSEADNHLKVL